MGFAADKGLRVKQGDRLVFIVLLGEGADGGVKGAIKVEWVRKGDLPEQMKKKKRGCRGGRNRPSVWAGGDDGVAHGRGLDIWMYNRGSNCVRVLIYDSSNFV